MIAAPTPPLPSVIHTALADGQPVCLRRITPDDVAWACDLLGGLTDRQWRDAFRAGGFADVTADRYIRRLKAKIDQGRRLSTASAAGG